MAKPINCQYCGLPLLWTEHKNELGDTWSAECSCGYNYVTKGALVVVKKAPGDANR